VNEHESRTIRNRRQPGSDRVASSISTGHGTIEISDYDETLDTAVEQSLLAPLPDRDSAEFDFMLLSTESGTAPSGQ
jgi:hypothetical protein